MKNSAEDPTLATGGAPGRSLLPKKLKRWYKDHRWPLLGFLWGIALVLGYFGFKNYFTAIGDPRSFWDWDIFYLTLQLFILESGDLEGIGLELQLARFLAPAAAGITAIGALAIILGEQLQLIRLRFWKGHIVICGLGRKGLLLSEWFRKHGERVVIIEQDENNGMLGRCRELGAILLMGNATDPGLLRRARVDEAKYLISVCGSDGTNAEVAVRARELVWDRKGKALSCLVHIVDFQLWNLLREGEIGMSKLDAFRLGFFNVFESGARLLLDEYPPFNKMGDDHGSRPHMVVVGVGCMGERLVVNAARNWWYRDNTGGRRLRITLIDKEAERKKESLRLRYPQLERVCELVPRQMDIQDPEFERAEFLFDHDGCGDVTMIYVCLDDDSHALGAALMLNERVRALEIPIVVRMTHAAGLATLLRGEKDKRESFANVHAFVLLDRTCTPDWIFGCTYEILARAIHEDYVRNERQKGVTRQTNPSTVPWEELPESLKESNRSQAQHIRVKLEVIGCDIALTTDWDAKPFVFSLEEVELMAEMEHQRFVNERLSDGWTYGSTKDVEKKTSPTLVPWKELPEEEKDKDRGPVRGLSAFLARAGFQIYRLKKGE